MKKKYFVKVGEKYGTWTIKKVNILYVKPSGGTLNKALCVCDCGIESLIEPGKLVTGTIKSCKVCSKLDRPAWNKGKTGIFSEETLKKISISKKGKHYSSKTEFEKGVKAWNKGMKMSDEFKRIVSEGHKGINKGEKAYNWIKDRNMIVEKHRVRSSFEWKGWRELIFKRDSYTCQECGMIGCYLEPHHIIPIRSDWDKLFDTNNGITLCRSCHIKTFGKEDKFAEKYFALLTKV